MFSSNLYAVVLYGSESVCNYVDSILKDTVNKSSMKMIDFLMNEMILPLVPFTTEDCCHLSLLPTLLGAEVSDRLNRQLADNPCRIIGSATSKNDSLLVVCQSKKDSLSFLKEIYWFFS